MLAMLTLIIVLVVINVVVGISNAEKRNVY